MSRFLLGCFLVLALASYGCSDDSTPPPDAGADAAAVEAGASDAMAEAAPAEASIPDAGAEAAPAEAGTDATTD